MTSEQWCFFSVPHLLWLGASVYNGHLRGPVTLTPIAKRITVEVSQPGLRLRFVAGGIYKYINVASTRVLNHKYTIHQKELNYIWPISWNTSVDDVQIGQCFFSDRKLTSIQYYCRKAIERQALQFHLETTTKLCNVSWRLLSFQTVEIST